MEQEGVEGAIEQRLPAGIPTRPRGADAVRTATQLMSGVMRPRRGRGGEERVVLHLQLEEELFELCQQLDVLCVDLAGNRESLLIPEEDPGDHLVDVVVPL